MRRLRPCYAAAFTALYLVRSVAAGLSHASFTAMTGLGVGVASESSNPGLRLFAPVAGWMAAVGLHFVHNFLATFLYDGGVGLVLKFLVFWTFDLLFFALVISLAVRDRSIVLRGLIDEAGRLLHPKELARTLHATARGLKQSCASREEFVKGMTVAARMFCAPLNQRG